MIVDGDVLSDDSRSLLLEILQAIYGAQLTIKTIEVVNKHRDYAALVVNIDHPSLQLAIKLAGKDAPYNYPFDRTAYWHKVVRTQTSIPMPDIIGVDVSYRDYPWRYLIKTYIPGEEWATVRPKLSALALRNAYESLGNAIGELHSISFDHFGDGLSRKSTDSSTDYYRVLTEKVHSSIQNSRNRSDFLALLERHKSLFSNVTQARLCHEDLHPYNILFRQTAGEWQLATILDFDKAWAGHHEIDLAKLALWTGMTGDGFWEQYQHHMGMDELFLERQPFYQLWWCLEYAANTPEHLADTRILCDLLHFPKIEVFE